ncbi:MULTISPECIES: hypothetical protein [unclassified Brevundimonas]|uniref:hypothetical protein n=1 Tax=unclassified Brevundimonas TaxID=2622653 RepID=UPI003F938215
MTFPATNCAFEGFRMTRRAPQALLAWALAYAVFFVLFFLVAGPHLVTMMSLMKELEGKANPSIEEMQPLMQAYGVMFAWGVPLAILLGAVLNTAIARSVIRPEDKRFGYLRVGKDELRVLAVNVIVALITGLTAMAAFMVVSVAAGLAMTVPALWLVVILLSLAAVALIVWLSVRLSLAVPITFAERRIAVKESFALTRGVFWPILGMGIIAWIMAVLVAVLGSAVAAPLSLLVGGMDRLAGLEGAGIAEMLRVAGPALAVSLVVNAILSAAQIAIMYAPFSAAYLHLKDAPRV